MRILLADDEPSPYYDDFLAGLARERPSDQIVVVTNAVKAHEELASAEGGGQAYDLLILDEKMGGGPCDGTALLRRLSESPLRKQPSIIYITGFFNEIPADQIAHSGTPVMLFLDKTSRADTVLFRAVSLVARQKEGPHGKPTDFFGERFVDLILTHVQRTLDSPSVGYLSLEQQRLIGSLVRSFFTTLRLRQRWAAEDLVELAVFLVEGLCRVYDLPEVIVKLVRRFLDIEEVLYTIPRYRDHFLHQLKVYLLGACIINELNSRRRLDHFLLSKPNAMKLWFLASIFHDLGYPFEKLRLWLDGFVLGVLRSPADGDSSSPLIPMEFGWGALFGRRYHWYHLERVADTICRHYDRSQPGVRAELVVCLASHVAQAPDHALFSSLIVQNLLRGTLTDDEVDPVAVAIALHSSRVSSAVREALTGELTFVRDPLSFLLMFCDAAQEWGRSEAHLRDVLASAGSSVFDGLRWSDDRSQLTVEVRFQGAWGPREVSRWKDFFKAEVLSLRRAWSCGQSSPVSFSVAYFHGDATHSRIPLDVLTL